MPPSPPTNLNATCVEKEHVTNPRNRRKEGKEKEEGEEEDMASLCPLPCTTVHFPSSFNAVSANVAFPTRNFLPPQFAVPSSHLTVEFCLRKPRLLFHCIRVLYTSQSAPHLCPHPCCLTFCLIAHRGRGGRLPSSLPTQNPPCFITPSPLPLPPFNDWRWVLKAKEARL